METFGPPCNTTNFTFVSFLSPISSKFTHFQARDACLRFLLHEERRDGREQPRPLQVPVVKEKKEEEGEIFERKNRRGKQKITFLKKEEKTRGRRPVLSAQIAKRIRL